MITVYTPPVQAQPVLFVNEDGLDFFNRQLASKLDGKFGSTFWSQLVLQLAHREPPVRHAVSAISLFCRDIEAGVARQEITNHDAYREWSKATRLLSARIQAQPDSNFVPLVCCLMFTCIEFIRGNIEASMLHAQSGFNILSGFRRLQSGLNSSTSSSRPTSPELDSIEEQIVPMFSRLQIICSLAGMITSPLAVAHTTGDHAPHKDLADSRRRLFQVADPCVRFIHQALPKVTSFSISMEDLIEQTKLQSKLDEWRDRLRELQHRMDVAGTPLQKDALSILLVHYKVICIWLQVCVVAGQSGTDAYHADFAELVNYAEEVVRPDRSERNPQPQPLSFDLHLLGPLYYTALKCRHPVTRRRALELLRWAPRREGLWNAEYAYATAKRVIEVEERYLQLHGQEIPDENERVHGLPLPNNESRVYSVGDLPAGLREGHRSMLPSPKSPGMLEAVFQMKPWGLMGEWRAVKEYIAL